MSEYRINVRFSLEDETQRRTALFLNNLDREKYGSRNAFAVNAICAYVGELLNGNPNARLLEDIRRLLLEVAPVATKAEPSQPKTLAVELSEEQKQNQANVALDFLKGF
ncbi:MAG: hypothetical protein IJL08_07400 [Oscillospiraceae bacterium]|nr:hypothetical protein [Oscillospiraceae bacterium]